MRWMWLAVVLLIVVLEGSHGQPLSRSIALLDLTQRNSESTSSRLFSAEHILKVAGLPFDIVTDPIEAMNHAILFCSSQLLSNSFTPDEKTRLVDYVTRGGVLVAPRVLDEELFAIFGISAFSESNTNYRTNWSKNPSNNLFRWIDESEEQSISLGDETLANIFKTHAYKLASAIGLGHYDDRSVAATQNSYGQGFAYAFGVSWKDVILRSQINRDFEAQRISSNGFEPTQDVIMLLVRAIICEHVPFATWKHTSPLNSTSTLMITHDIDGSTGMDTSHIFSESEKAMDISATYYVTVRYFSDALITDFYNGSQDKISAIISDGHVIASHSVGHFPDFADTSAFPIGSPGNSMTNYQPDNDGFETIGGNVFGECEVSKNVLEQDHGIQIKAFRSGHLAYNNHLVDVLDSLDYLYNSSYSASDVLTHFPYQNITGRTFSGTRSNIYEVPVSVSDVFHDDPINAGNYLEKADQWLEVLKKLDANNSPTVLLIHPNRTYKLAAQEYFISNLPVGVRIAEMTAFADYWRARDVFDFETRLQDETLYITIPREHLLRDSSISLIINNGQHLSEIISQDENALPIEFITEDWGNNDVILYQPDVTLGLLPESETQLALKLYPNPVTDQLNIDINLGRPSGILVEILDVFGLSILRSATNKYSAGHHRINVDIPPSTMLPGIYICRIGLDKHENYFRKIILE